MSNKLNFHSIERTFNSGKYLVWIMSETLFPSGDTARNFTGLFLANKRMFRQWGQVWRTWSGVPWAPLLS